MNRTYRTTASAALAAGVGICLAACAPMEEPAADEYDATLAALDTERACFFTREINGYSNAPESSSRNERIWVSTGARERFLLETRGVCPELDFSRQIALDTAGSTNVCTGQTEILLVPSNTPGNVERCPVTVLGRDMNG